MIKLLRRPSRIAVYAEIGYSVWTGQHVPTFI